LEEKKRLNICALIFINPWSGKMVKCDVCGEETALPFKCRYCGGTFCSTHRLPENHSCKKLAEIKPPEREQIFREVAPEREEVPQPMEMRYKIMMPRVFRKRPRFFRDFLLRQASIAILLVIFAVFIVQLIAQAALGTAYYRPGDYDTFLYYLTPSPATVLARPWTLLTSIFAHGGFAHLLVNVIVLFSLGPVLEMRIGRKRFVYLFLGAGILAGAAQLLVIPSNIVVLGASGAILGVLGTLTVLIPRLPVLLFFFIPMQLWVVTLVFGGLSALLVLTARGGSIAHMAHLIGLVVGLVYGYKLQRKEKRRYRHFFQQFLDQ